MKKIVVGTDGSQNAAVALRWAAEEATIHGASLEVVLVWNFLVQYHHGQPDAFDPDYTEESALAALASWVEDALGAASGVEQRAVCDVPPPALLEAGDSADLLVLGARGQGGFEGMLLGSVSDRVAHLATRPVAVVRDTAPVRHGRVVVGIDGSARSLGALRWAASEARARDTDLDVVHAWRMPMMAASPVVAAFPDLATMEAAGRETLDEALADPALAGTQVHPHLTEDNAANALMARTTDAGLVVVGTRGLGRVTGALLGSVSRQLLHHAPCPVVVI
jgi:nucleotide-binding universal stress UspA family protein